MDFKRFALVVASLFVIGFIGYRVYETGGLRDVFQRVRPSPTATGATPMPSSSLSGSPIVASPSSDALTVLAVMNARRSEAGSGVLAVNGILQYQAQRHATDMAARNYFSHDTPEGVTFQQRMTASGYPSVVVAENIGLSSSGQASDVVPVWMNSVAHRTNVLDARFRAAGVGVAKGAYQDQPAVYVVVIFGDTP